MVAGKLLCSIVSQRTVFLQTRNAFHFGTVVSTKKKKKKNPHIGSCFKEDPILWCARKQSSKGNKPKSRLQQAPP